MEMFTLRPKAIPDPLTSEANKRSYVDLKGR